MAATVRLNQAGVNYLLTSSAGPIALDLLRRGRRVEARAKQLCPVDSGRLRSSIGTGLVVSGGRLSVQIGTNVKYAKMVHDGTGIYGPRGRPIRPVNGRYLVFRPRGSNVVVFAREVRGMRPHPFLKNALPAAA